MRHLVKYWSLCSCFFNDRTKFVKETYRELELKSKGKFKSNLEGLLAFISFSLIANVFPEGGFLIKNNTLIDFWSVPFVFVGAATLIKKVKSVQNIVPSYILIFFKATSGGAFIALTYGSILILNEWYFYPEQASWEPLFVATGLSSSGVYMAYKFFHKTMIEQEKLFNN